MTSSLTGATNPLANSEQQPRLQPILVMLKPWASVRVPNPAKVPGQGHSNHQPKTTCFDVDSIPVAALRIKEALQGFPDSI